VSGLLGKMIHFGQGETEMKSRPVAKLRGCLEQRLAAYAVAASASGIGLLGCPQPAAARIIYTKADQQLQPGTPLPLDLDHNGIVDFSLYFTGVSTYGGFYLAANANGANQVVGYCQHISQGCWASAVRSDIPIGPNRRFAPYNYMLFGGCETSSCFARGPWNNVQKRYLGFRFSIKGRMHYGWARLTVSIHQGVAAVLTGYAYETIPDKPLITGKTKGANAIAPELGTLGHLARGTPDDLGSR
jgi:hypothetical protein